MQYTTFRFVRHTFCTDLFFFLANFCCINLSLVPHNLIVFPLLVISAIIFSELVYANVLFSYFLLLLSFETESIIDYYDLRHESLIHN